jgi:hypothetical protein
MLLIDAEDLGGVVCSCVDSFVGQFCPLKVNPQDHFYVFLF